MRVKTETGVFQSSNLPKAEGANYIPRCRGSLLLAPPTLREVIFLLGVRKEAFLEKAFRLGIFRKGIFGKEVIFLLGVLTRPFFSQTEIW